MPGPSFLFKKRFHPSRIDNQKKLFIAEQSVANREKFEAERSEEVKKELDLTGYGLNDAVGERDAKYTSLKFMYSMPQAEKDKILKGNAGGKYFEPKVGEDGDDEMVRKFRESLEQRSQPSMELLPPDKDKDKGIVQSGKREVGAPLQKTKEESEEEYLRRKKKLDPGFGASSSQSNLERETGKRRKLGLTFEEQVERFPVLKNAPVEGSFAKDIQLRHKPFNEVIRNVQCVRCGEWGHLSGDRECALRDYNPHDFARQKREDPLTFMKSSKYLAEKQNMTLRQALSDQTQFQEESSQRRTKTDVAGDVESDPEAEFIASLTSREKKLLLRKLEELETGVKAAPLSSDESDSDSDNSSSTSSSGSDDSSVKEKRAKKSSSKKTKKSKSHTHKHKRRKEKR